MRFSQTIILSILALGVFGAPVAHHTEAQIAAKNAAAAKGGQQNQDCQGVQARDPHHTEAQIAAKNAAAGKNGAQACQQKNQARAATPPPDEFGPWDSTEDEFGSWLKSREPEPEPEPHHTEAQIAAKNAAAGQKQACQKNQKRHHTEAQIAAQNAAKGDAGKQSNDCAEN